MKIKMNRLYGLKGNAYYRKQGSSCFDFVGNINYASELTEEESNQILKNADWYCKQYNAESLEILR